MLFLVWTIVGLALALIWGLIARRNTHESFASVILLATTGAVTGGLLFMLFGITSWTTDNTYSLVVSAVGAITFLAAYHSIKHAY